MDEVIRDIYFEFRKEARDAKRLALILLLISVYVYAINIRYAELSYEKRKAESVSERLEKQITKVCFVVESLKNLKSVSDNFSASLEYKLRYLRSQFDILSTYVNAVTNPGDDSESGSDIATRPHGTQAILQSTPSSGEMQAVLPDFNDVEKKGIKAALSESGDLDTHKLRKTLSDYVDSNIIQPWFDEVNELWKQDHLESIKTQADTLKKELAKLESEFRKSNMERSIRDANSINSVIAHVDDANTAAESLQFSPPEDPNWCWFIPEKIRLVSGLGEAAAKSADGLVKDEQVLRQLHEDLKTAQTRNSDLVEDLQDDQDTKKKEIAKLSEQAGSIVKPLALVALDPEFLCKNLPALLGGVIAILIYWQHRCQCRLSLCQNLLVATAEDKKATDRLLSLAQLDKTDLPWTLLALVSIVWICISGGQLAYFGSLSVGRMLVLTVFGSMLIVAAVYWRSRETTLASRAKDACK